MGAAWCSKVKADIEAEAKTAEADAQKLASTVSSAIMSEINNTLVPQLKTIVENAIQQTAAQVRTEMKK